MLDTASLFDISVSGLIAAFIFGVIGMWLFKEGRRRAKMELTLIGVAQMVYPYFTPNSKNSWIDWAAGIALCWAAHYYWDRDLF